MKARKEREQPMPSSKVVVLSEDQIKVLLANCEHAISWSAIDAAVGTENGEPAFTSAKDALRAVLQQEGEVDETVGWRVAGDNDGDTYELISSEDQIAAELWAVGPWPAYVSNVRVQKQTAYTGPWVDLDDQEGEQ